MPVGKHSLSLQPISGRRARGRLMKRALPSGHDRMAVIMEERPLYNEHSLTKHTHAHIKRIMGFRKSTDLHNTHGYERCQVM